MRRGDGSCDEGTVPCSDCLSVERGFEELVDGVGRSRGEEGSDGEGEEDGDVGWDGREGESGRGTEDDEGCETRFGELSVEG